MSQRLMRMLTGLTAEKTDEKTYTNGYVELSVEGNDTAKIVDGVLEFDGNATLNVKALNDTGGTLYVDMGDGDIFEYNIDVIEEHECSSDKWVTVLPSVNNEAGYQACYCDICDELIGFRDTETCGTHNFGEWKSSLDATCVDGGIKIRECTECGYTETEFTDAVGHAEELQNAVAATCTEAGYTGDKYCAVCNIYLEKGTVIPALNHNYGKWTKIDSDGHQRVCENDKTHIEKSKHTMTGWAVKTAATCTAEGVSERSCTECGYAETKPIAKTEHTSSGWIGISAATCTEDGERCMKCTVCGAVLKTETVPAHGHADADKNGKCDNCGESLTSSCKHICHSKNKLAQFFWKMIRLMYKLFKNHEFCDCGVRHW